MTPPRGAQAPSPVRATTQRLLRLRPAGEQLDLRPGTVHARQGGQYLSPFKGRGMEFDQVRPYQPGDDIRHIDWRVTARSGRAHTKLFREERERPVYFWIDLSPSMFFGSRRVFKAVAACEAAILLAWGAAARGDRTGGMIFAASGQRLLRPGRGPAAVAALIGELCRHPVWDTPAGAIGAPLAEHFSPLLHLLKPGSLVFILSDFRAHSAADQRQLGQVARHSDLVLVHVHDPLERELPPPGQYRVLGGEGEFTVDTSGAAARDGYRRRFEQRVAELQAFCRGRRALYLPLATSADPAAALVGQLGRRPGG